MPIPPAYAKRYVYHFTHLDNLEGVLMNGFLSCNEQIRLKLRHHSIAIPNIQERRSRMAVPCGPGGVVHDYVPLYFSKLSPMLLGVVNSKNVDQELLLHFAYPIDLLDRRDVVFTNAAANTVTSPDFYEDPARLDQLDWAAIDRTKWGSDSEGQKHARMAEALVHKKLEPTQASYLLVWNEAIKKRVLEVFEKAGVPAPRIEWDGYDGYHSFTHFKKGLPKDMLKTSVSAGPRKTKATFLEAVGQIDTLTASSKPEFGSLSELLQAFQRDGLKVLPETGELIGLESENEVHKEDVGTHTLIVVEKLLASAEYHALTNPARVLVEIAAFLHDIGKGPKARWADCGGKQQVDPAHPLRSVNMLPRILTESVATSDESSRRTLCMLVCYHDLVGDIIGRGRDREQLLGVVRDRDELDMLIAIGKADMSSVARGWGFIAEAKLPQLRKWAIEHLSDDEHEDDDDNNDDGG